MTQIKLILDHVYDHETTLAERVFLTQPVGGGQVRETTWAQLMDQSRRMATHLQGLGLAPGARVALLSKNCAHFIMAELAIWMAGYTTVAIFPTETAETVRYVLEHSEASLLFVGKLDTWAQQSTGVPAGLPRIALPLAPETGDDTWDAIVARTPPIAGRPARQRDDLAMLMYTSGSTGTPKGVMVSFEAITRAGEGIAADTRSRVGAHAPSRMLSYLPLAHSFERSWVEASALVDGHTHLYFAQSLDTFMQDLQRARPTLFISVPRLWLKFQRGVFAKMPPAKLERLLAIPLLGRLVARKVRKGLGLDQVIVAGSGSAPIPAELIAWYRRIGLALYEGYGMTEDSSYSHTSNARFNAPGYVGVPLPGVQVRIAEDGEILIKSPGRLKGYFKRPDLDAESFTEDGYFRTGDLGERRADGLLKITGRVKELFKTTKGEYVAPAPIENQLNAHPMVELSMVSGLGQPAPYAMVVLAEDLRPRVGDPAVRMQVQAELERLLTQVNQGLPDHAKLRMIVVTSDPWSIENGCLTPTMKIKRARIEAAAAPQLERWYADGQPVRWI
ncbi:AMP-binding protein [Piscinibacter sp.]|jgi:long-chain acyl-CoA synthetase|uniref:AMP-binding protein n=1 Tax=Piscinibacter sp. TaxID=1903157 RepID=UPI00355AA336